MIKFAPKGTLRDIKFQMSYYYLFSDKAFGKKDTKKIFFGLFFSSKSQRGKTKAQRKRNEIVWLKCLMVSNTQWGTNKKWTNYYYFDVIFVCAYHKAYVTQNCSFRFMILALNTTLNGMLCEPFTPLSHSSCIYPFYSLFFYSVMMRLALERYTSELSCFSMLSFITNNELFPSFLFHRFIMLSFQLLIIKASAFAMQTRRKGKRRMENRSLSQRVPCEGKVEWEEGGRWVL